MISVFPPPPPPFSLPPSFYFFFFPFSPFARLREEWRKLSKISGPPLSRLFASVFPFPSLSQAALSEGGDCAEGRSLPSFSFPFSFQRAEVGWHRASFTPPSWSFFFPLFSFTVADTSVSCGASRSRYLFFFCWREIALSHN